MKTATFYLLALLFYGTYFVMCIRLPENFQYTGNYMINGTTSSKFSYAPNVTVQGPTALIVNTAKNRMVWIGGNADTVFISMNNGSYFFGNTLGPLCLYRPFTYNQTVIEYSASKKVDEEHNGLISIYEGAVYDYGSCNAVLAHRTSVLGWDNNNVLTRQEFTQKLFLPANSTAAPTCVDYYGVVEFNTFTYRTNVNFDPFFQLPPSCWKPLPYCSIAYPDPTKQCEPKPLTF